MAISEKKIIPLNIDNCEAFIPKKRKDKLELDLTLIEEDDQLLKLKDTPRRKSSTGSTSVTKPEEQSELLSIPNSPLESPQVIEQKGIFFGKTQNSNNHIFNYFHSTQMHLLEEYNQFFRYKNSKNYLLKTEMKSKKNIFENINKNIIKNNNIEAVNPNNNFQNIKSNIPITAKGTFTPKICTIVGKGKFDLPMCYLFCGWDCKNKINNYNFEIYS